MIQNAEITLTPIGRVHSPYKEKFAIPRQPGLIEDGEGMVELLAPYNQKEIVRGLEQFSHLWLLFIFHQTMGNGWSPTVRPPRLGGNTRMGVFATRSPFRPNPIGLSLVELKQIDYQDSGIFLKLASIDLVDGTPIVDIKPYLPFAESLPDAIAGFAQDAPVASLSVEFTLDAEIVLNKEAQRYPNLKRFISQVLEQDPRPAYKKEKLDERDYAVHLLEFNVRWRVVGSTNLVFAIEHV